MPSFSWSPLQGTSSGSVTSVNSLTGALTLAAGTGITINDNGSSVITIASSSAGDVTIAAFGSTPNAFGLSISGSQALNLQPADATHPGGITAADWNTFNNKQAAGNYITALTGDGTASGPGSAALTLATVNSNVGSFAIATVTVNAKGLVTAASAASTTGSGSVVLATAPTMTSPVVGTQSQNDNSTKAASTAYVDLAITNALAGVNPAVAVQAATTSSSSLSGYTYSNGVSGIGATLTAGSTNTALTVDGYTFTALNQRLLVKDQSSSAQNGVYYVTQVQALGLPVILTRALDYDMPSDMNNTGAIPVENGTVNAITQWVLTTLVTTVGTDPLTFTKFSRNPADYLLVASNLSDVASSATAFNNLSAMTLLGDMLYGGASGTRTVLAGNTTSTKKFLTQTGSGTVSAAPGWNTIAAADVPTLNQNTTGTAANVTGTVAIANGGTGQTSKAAGFDALSPMSAGGDLIYGGASGTGTRLANGSANQYLASAGGTSAPAWTSFTAPTVQTFTSTGTTTGTVFTVTSANATVGATYTNNGTTYTVQGTISAGTTLFMLGNAALSGNTLTKASGTGDSSITFSVSAATGTYTTPTSPRAPLYIRIRGVGGGSGGAAGGNQGTAVAGGTTFFGANIITLGGGGATSSGNSQGGTGGTPTINSPAVGSSFTGGAGQGGQRNVTSNATYLMGGDGAPSPFGGMAGGGAGNSNGQTAAANTGSGGGGGGSSNGTSIDTGAGGGAGAYCDTIIPTPSATYPIRIGSGGAGGTGSVSNGGAGAAGYIEVTEYYQ